MSHIIVTTAEDLKAIVQQSVREAVQKLRREEEARAHQAPAEDAELMTRKEAATYLKVTIGTIDNYVRDGLLDKIRVGVRQVRLRTEQVRRLGTRPT